MKTNLQLRMPNGATCITAIECPVETDPVMVALVRMVRAYPAMVAALRATVDAHVCNCLGEHEGCAFCQCKAALLPETDAIFSNEATNVEVMD